jgi:hypothetical protein
MLKERKGEQIGGGYFIHRRNKKTGRIANAVVPFEHPSYGSAKKEAARLRKLSPENTFVIFKAMKG